MKKFMGSLRQPSRRGSSRTPVAATTPDESIKQDIKLFVESSQSLASGDEVLQLPKIVEAAEASPKAAAAAVKQIRKTLGTDQWNTAYKQYHSIMLLRIMIDNPASCKNLAKNIDNKFREAMLTLLRSHRDPSVQQIARETLDHFAQEKAQVTDLKPLLDMWAKEKSTTGNRRQSRAPTQQQGNWRDWQGAGQARGPPGAPVAGQGPHASHSNGRPKHTLPSQVELAGRIEEARTSAKLLIQLTQSTPPTEFEGNELIREFAERCQSAQRNLHGYMNSDPPPDEETFQTLIETCEQLSLASSKHQRAALAARKLNKDTLQRPDNLYNGISRDASPNAAAPPPPQIRTTMPSAPPSTFSPSSRHTSPKDEKSTLAEPYNPFADENQSYYPTARRDSSKVSPPTPQAPFAELPTTSTPPVPNGEGFAAPPGPPPGRKPVPSHEERDTYTSMDTLEHSQERRPLTADSDELYSAHEPKGYERDEHEVNGADATMLLNRGKGRVKDDEPFSSVGGVSGSGWNY